MRTNIEKITNDLGPNYKDTDKEIIEEIYEEINSIASNISGLKKEDTASRSRNSWPGTSAAR